MYRKYGFNAVCGRIFDGRNGVRYGKTRPVQWRSGRADGTVRVPYYGSRITVFYGSGGHRRKDSRGIAFVRKPEMERKHAKVQLEISSPLIEHGVPFFQAALQYVRKSQLLAVGFRLLLQGGPELDDQALPFGKNLAKTIVSGLCSNAFTAFTFFLIRLFAVVCMIAVVLQSMASAIVRIIRAARAASYLAALCTWRSATNRRGRARLHCVGFFSFLAPYATLVALVMVNEGPPLDSPHISPLSLVCLGLYGSTLWMIVLARDFGVPTATQSQSLLRFRHLPRRVSRSVLVSPFDFSSLGEVHNDALGLSILVGIVPPCPQNNEKYGEVWRSTAPSALDAHRTAWPHGFPPPGEVRADALGFAVLGEIMVPPYAQINDDDCRPPVEMRASALVLVGMAVPPYGQIDDGRPLCRVFLSAQDAYRAVSPYGCPSPVEIRVVSMALGGIAVPPYGHINDEHLWTYIVEIPNFPRLRDLDQPCYPLDFRSLPPTILPPCTCETPPSVPSIPPAVLNPLLPLILAECKCGLLAPIPSDRECHLPIYDMLSAVSPPPSPEFEFEFIDDLRTPSPMSSPLSTSSAYSQEEDSSPERDTIARRRALARRSLVFPSSPRVLSPILEVSSVASSSAPSSAASTASSSAPPSPGGSCSSSCGTASACPSPSSPALRSEIRRVDAFTAREAQAHFLSFSAGLKLPTTGRVAQQEEFQTNAADMGGTSTVYSGTSVRAASSKPLNMLLPGFKPQEKLPAPQNLVVFRSGSSKKGPCRPDCEDIYCGGECVKK
ncbi:hypothetical protein DFH09DRAFT_1272167 [Mycena vulgaris]|nr:hypothetical protein DFH09DRAFT_1272167 [Mycena vulgaris]